MLRANFDHICVCVGLMRHLLPFLYKCMFMSMFGFGFIFLAVAVEQKGPKKKTQTKIYLFKFFLKSFLHSFNLTSNNCCNILHNSSINGSQNFVFFAIFQTTLTNILFLLFTHLP